MTDYLNAAGTVTTLINRMGDRDRMGRERDDFDDLDETESEPLPRSSWFDLDEFEQDRLTSRQQTGMAGE